jgi:hypothetical protein
MPGIGVDLLDGLYVTQVETQPAARGAGGKEKILVGLVVLGGHSAVVKFVEAAAITIDLTIHYEEVTWRGSFQWGWNATESEIFGRIAVIIVTCNDGDFAAGRSGQGNQDCEE